MRIAVVGSGVSGLVSSWLLSRQHEVTLFEAAGHFGGHVHTHDIVLQDQKYAVDSGFIVFNPQNYPLLTRLFSELEVVSQPTTMSFSVRNERTALEYNATSLGSLFCQRRNLVAPRFLGMVADLLRFYRRSPELLRHENDGPTIGEYLQQHRYGDAFRDDHLLPMAGALWSAPPQQVLEFPARYLVQFMANHQMLQVSGRPQWRVVRGGSASYVSALRARWQVTERPRTPVRRIRRSAQGVELGLDTGSEHFDQVVLACHSDQALALLEDPSESECSVLGAMPYQKNEVLLHTDPGVLPSRRRIWAAWNAFIPAEASQSCTVSYSMNLLQGITSPEPLIVTLNQGGRVDPRRILRRMQYEHPVYCHQSVRAQSRKPEIQGQRNTWYAGAYWGWGFHEDGARSAAEVAAALGVRWAPPAELRDKPDPRLQGGRLIAQRSV
jgi:uncharacterized protein